MTRVESKKSVHDLHQKYYGNKSGKKAEQKTVVQERADTIIKEKGPSRADLADRAKSRGIKYTQILSKEDLLFIDSNTLSADELQQIIDRAKNKWKAGWGTRKNAAMLAGADHKE